jgi:hypothetical protein
MVGVFAGMVGHAQASARADELTQDAIRNTNEYRRMAWQYDDFYAQWVLGYLYSSDSNFKDLAEAYVWYFLAYNNTNVARYQNWRSGENPYIDKWLEVRATKRQIFEQLDSAQRTEAANRIVYILASRGPRGLVNLADFYSIPSEANKYPSSAELAINSSGQLFTQLHRGKRPGLGSEPLGGKGLNPAPTGNNTQQPQDSAKAGVTSYYIAPSERLIPESLVESLLYNKLALPDPYAAANVQGLEKYLTSIGSQDLIEIANLRAKSWIPPFEYYPEGFAKAGNLTDASPLFITEENALHLVDKGALKKDYVYEALGFVFSTSVKTQEQIEKRSAEFQNTMGEWPTGRLNAKQQVRAIQAAAVRGHANSQNRLGVMYFFGVGVPQSYPRAEKWWLQAAEQGHPAAAYQLSRLYATGPDGVARDMDRANTYAARAAVSGFVPARQEFRELFAATKPSPNGELPPDPRKKPTNFEKPTPIETPESEGPDPSNAPGYQGDKTLYEEGLTGAPASRAGDSKETGDQGKKKRVEEGDHPATPVPQAAGRKTQ